MSVEHSFDSFHCICGEQIKSESEQAVCPSCKRLIVIEWQAHYSAGKEKSA